MGILISILGNTNDNFIQRYASMQEWVLKPGDQWQG